MFCSECGAVTGTGPLDARFHDDMADRGPEPGASGGFAGKTDPAHTPARFQSHPALIRNARD
jgi:hypothetical protein